MVRFTVVAASVLLAIALCLVTVHAANLGGTYNQQQQNIPQQLTHPLVQSFSMHRSSNGNTKAQAAAAMGNPHYQRVLRAQEHGARLNAASRSMHVQSAPDGTGIAPLTGCPFADFTVPVMIGRLSFDLIVDTGSGSTAVAGVQCTKCTGVSPLWQSSSFSKDMGQTATGAYGDATGWAGKVWKDRVAFGNGAGSNVTAFAQSNIVVIVQQSTKGFDQNGQKNDNATPFFSINPCVDPVPNRGVFSQGIVGIGYPSLASTNTDSVLFNIWNGSPSMPKQFAMQMCEATGTMWIGGYDSARTTAEPLYTPISEERFYSISPYDMSVNGVSLSIPASAWGSGKHIIDSGTTLWELPTPIYRLVVDAVLADPTFKKYFRSNATDNFFDHSPGACEYPDGPDGTSGTWQELQFALPTITLKMRDGLELTMDGVGSYLMPCSDQFDQWTPGISPNDQGGLIGGWPLLNQFVVIHDVQNKQVGFAPSAGCATGRDPLRANVTRSAAAPGGSDDGSTADGGGVGAPAAYNAPVFVILGALAALVLAIGGQ